MITVSAEENKITSYWIKNFHQYSLYAHRSRLANPLMVVGVLFLALFMGQNARLLKSAHFFSAPNWNYKKIFAK